MLPLLGLKSYTEFVSRAKEVWKLNSLILEKKGYSIFFQLYVFILVLDALHLGVRRTYFYCSTINTCLIISI